MAKSCAKGFMGNGNKTGGTAKPTGFMNNKKGAGSKGSPKGFMGNKGK